jgi:hypothetical protein
MFLNMLSNFLDERDMRVYLNTLRRTSVFFLSGILMLAGLFGRVCAEAPSVVEELLKLDTQAALISARQKVVGPLTLSGPAASHGTGNVLLAIYGVGQSLTAEVLLDAEPHVFKNRRQQPMSGSSVQYILERIAPPCVHLKKIEHRETLCLGQRTQ